MKEKPRSMNISGKRLELNHLGSFLYFSNSNSKSESCAHSEAGLRKKEKKNIKKLDTKYTFAVLVTDTYPYCLKFSMGK